MLRSEQRSVRKGNELVKVAVNVISLLAEPRAAALPLQAITWLRTRAACLSTLLPRLAFTHSRVGGGWGEKLFKKEKERRKSTHKVIP